MDALSAGRGGTVKKAALGLIALGAILSIIALMDEEARVRFGFSYLTAYVCCWAVVLGSMFFVALQHVTKSVWSVTLRRAAEMLIAPMWVLALLFIPIVVLALANKDLGILAWLRGAEAVHDADLPNSQTLGAKAPYLNQGFFLVRTVIFFALWIGFSVFYVRGSLKQDESPAASNSSSLMQKVSGPFMIIFAFTLTFAAFDWMMALRPDWFSTMYGVYVFSGVALSGLAATTLAVIGMRSKGYIEPKLVKSDHLYSLGALLFAFTCFWGYISFSQFMLIWYANMPEETVYYTQRMQGGWLCISWTVVVLRFVLPFFLLLSRRAKMHPQRLIGVAILILVGQVFDAYWLIMPEMDGPVNATPAFLDLGPLALLSGILLLYVGVWMGRHRTVAEGDPLFEASRNYHLH